MTPFEWITVIIAMGTFTVQIIQAIRVLEEKSKDNEKKDEHEENEELGKE